MTLRMVAATLAMLAGMSFMMFFAWWGLAPIHGNNSLYITIGFLVGGFGGTAYLFSEIGKADGRREQNTLSGGVSRTPKYSEQPDQVIDINDRMRTQPRIPPRFQWDNIEPEEMM